MKLVRERVPSKAVALGLILLGAGMALAAVPDVEHVIVVGVDGMSPAGIRAVSTPNLDALMAHGAYTLHARAVMPTSSSPNWASIIMGAGPEQHGVTSNDWEPDRFDVAPTAVGPGGIFPTIFAVLREQRPTAHIAALYEWGGFGRLFEHQAVDFAANPRGARLTTTRSAEYIVEHRPTFLFVHLDHVDHAGHEFGHGTDEYFAAIEEADGYIGEIVKAINSAGIAESTMVLVTADHGGKGKGHGGATMEEIEIPWILAGPGVARGKELSEPLDTYQTAATIAHIFGLQPPEAWIGRPVLSAFQE